MDDQIEQMMSDVLRDPAPARTQLKRLSPTHENMINWLIANQDQPLRVCAAAFGVTQSWLSCVIHSDIFQAKLKRRQDEHFARISTGLTEKLKVLADVAVERLTEKVETSEDPKFLRESFDSVLGKLGYAPNRNGNLPPVMQQNNFFVSKEDLAKARDGILQKSVAATIEQSVVPSLPQPMENSDASDN